MLPARANVEHREVGIFFFFFFPPSFLLFSFPSSIKLQVVVAHQHQLVAAVIDRHLMILALLHREVATEGRRLWRRRQMLCGAEGG